MKIKSTVLAVCGLVMSLSSQATTTVDMGSYWLSFDETTVFGGISYGFGGSGNVVGFSWVVPPAVQIASVGGASVNRVIDLPSFTVQAKSGYALSGAVGGFLGNLVFNEVGAAASTSVSLSGLVSIDGGVATALGGLLSRSVTISEAGAFANGYHSGTSSVPSGSFSSFSFSDGSLLLSASGGSFASITTQPQNELKISFFATQVPEPETYALLLAGLGVIGALSRRRRIE